MEADEYAPSQTLVACRVAWRGVAMARAQHVHVLLRVCYSQYEFPDMRSNTHVGVSFTTFCFTATPDFVEVWMRLVRRFWRWR